MDLAQSLLDALKARGVQELFGIPGAFALPLFKVIEESRVFRWRRTRCPPWPNAGTSRARWSLPTTAAPDGSQALATRLGARVVNCPVKGYGAALRHGIASALGRFIVMGDADASYDFAESVPMVERLLAGDELCMGTRLEGKIMPGAMPWKNRHSGNPLLTGVLNFFFHSGLSDAHSGLRAFTKDAFVRLAPTSTGIQ
jgi:hypothetical protein